MNWCITKYRSLGNERLPIPSREEIATWINEVWDSLPLDFVKNSWRGCGLNVSLQENTLDDIANIPVVEDEELCLDYITTLSELKSMAIL